MNQNFPKKERITSQKLVDKLFQEGKYFYTSFLRCNYLLKDRSQPDKSFQILINVPKRIHKTAVARNRIKRRIREAYRLNKEQILSIIPDQIELNIAVIYIHKTIRETAEIESDFKKLIEQLAKKIG